LTIGLFPYWFARVTMCKGEGPLQLLRQELQAAFTDMLRIIKEVDPPKAGTKLSETTNRVGPGLSGVGLIRNCSSCCC
jgi:hypothetical protein